MNTLFDFPVEKDDETEPENGTTDGQKARRPAKVAASSATAELSAMGAAASDIDVLDRDAKHRVVRWLADRYGGVAVGPTMPGPAAPVQRATGAGAPPPADKSPTTYTTFAEMYDRAEPRDDGEGIVTAIYWLQAGGATQTDSFHINKELNDLGRKVARVRDILPKLMAAKPALVLQVSHGKGQAGHRIVKLSAAGTKAVEAALAAGGFEHVG
jgi:hypothetical protein